MKELTLDLLEQMMPAASDKMRIKFLSPLAMTLETYEIDNYRRIAAFMANVEHESCSLRYVEEIASGKAYNERKDLGNTRPEAMEIARLHDTEVGVFYKGHGLFQITGYDNHKKVSIALGIDAVNAPKILTTPRYASLSAGWFWHSHYLNELADEDRFTEICKRINGGLNGLEERKEFYRNNVKVLKNAGFN